MKRLAYLIPISLLATACGDGDANLADAQLPDTPPAAERCPGAEDPSNPGFNCPTRSARAWTRDEEGAWEEVGPADFSCLGTPSVDTPSTVDIDLTVQVNDFQNGTVARVGATVEAFPGVAFDEVLDTGETDETGETALTLPAGQERVGFKVVSALNDQGNPVALDTYTLNLHFNPEEPEQSLTLNSVSTQTAGLVTALIDVVRTPGTGILAGSFRDCAGNPVSDVIATVSATSGSHDHLEGGQTYYFTAAATSLPTTHINAPQMNRDGLFVVIELPVAASAYLQVWGFTADQDPEKDPLTLIAEIPSPVVADSVIVAGLEPARQD